MTYLILGARPIGFALICQTELPSEALASLDRSRKHQALVDLGAISLVEVVIGPDDPATKLTTPAELDQAITAWNEKITGKIKGKTAVRKTPALVKRFEAWRKGVGQRNYFLWQCVDDILAANDFLQHFILFGLLLRQAKESKEWHSDLLRAGHYRDPNRRAPEPEIVSPPLERIDVIRMQRIPIYRLLDEIGDPETNTKARGYFNKLATRITADSSGDRWEHWKELCAEAGFDPRPQFKGAQP